MAKKQPTSEVDAPTDPPGFEQALENLEAIVRRLEHGGGTLAAALDDYSAAIGLLKHCHLHLEEAQRRVELLSGVDADGNPVTVEVQETEITLEQKQELRSDRRAAVSGRMRVQTSQTRGNRRANDDLERGTAGGLFE